MCIIIIVIITFPFNFADSNLGHFIFCQRNPLNAMIILTANLLATLLRRLASQKIIITNPFLLIPLYVQVIIILSDTDRFAIFFKCLLLALERVQTNLFFFASQID